jgi:hypothetical protein
MRATLTVVVVAVAAAGAVPAVSAAPAHAQACNPEGTACIDTAGPLMPAQVIEFRVEAGATGVRSLVSQPAKSALARRFRLVSLGPPGGLDTYQGVMPGQSDPICSPGCTEPVPFADGTTTVNVSYDQPTTGKVQLHKVEYQTIAPVGELAASILTGTGDVVGELSFEARREVRGALTLALSGKRVGSNRGWRRFAETSADQIVGIGTHAIHTPPLSRRCPARYDKCKANVSAGVLTEAAGEWWRSSDTSAKLKPLR